VCEENLVGGGWLYRGSWGGLVSHREGVGAGEVTEGGGGGGEVLAGGGAVGGVGGCHG